MTTYCITAFELDKDTGARATIGRVEVDGLYTPNRFPGWNGAALAVFNAGFAGTLQRFLADKTVDEIVIEKVTR